MIKVSLKPGFKGLLYRNAKGHLKRINPGDKPIEVEGAFVDQYEHCLTIHNDPAKVEPVTAAPEKVEPAPEPETEPSQEVKATPTAKSRSTRKRSSGSRSKKTPATDEGSNDGE